MSTLLLRFAAPMQSWGNDSKYDTRRTQREPTKSGIVGLMAAAQGRSRDADISDLNRLRIGIRTDRQGKMLRDFHIVRKMKGEKVESSYVTNRYYLCDAVFLVGIESEDRAVLEGLKQALLFPAFPLFLGRRSCPPEGRVFLDVVDTDLETSLAEYPLLVEEKTASYPLQVVVEAEDGIPVNDLPLSFSPLNRRYGYRLAKKYYLRQAQSQEHDPMEELR